MTRPGPHLNPHPNTYPRQVCKLWRALHRTRLARASSAALRAAHAPHAPDAPQEADAEGGINKIDMRRGAAIREGVNDAAALEDSDSDAEYYEGLDEIGH